MFSKDGSNRKPGEWVTKQFTWATISVVILAATSAFAVQDSPALNAVTRKHPRAAAAHAPAAHAQESAAQKNPDLGESGPLISEFAHLAAKIQQGVQVPGPRTQSKLLGLLPVSTSVYLSVPNYGEALHQANQIFNQELQESTVLSEWWQNKVGIAGMMVEAGIEQVHQFAGYLGDEIVISGTVKPKGGSLLVVAEVRKPGIKAFLQGLLDQYGGNNAPVQLLTPQQLLTAKAPGKNQLMVLVRPDFLVVASDLPALRTFNAQLTRGAGTFASTPFGQRLAQAYQGGVSGVLGTDLQQLLALRPKGQPQSEAMFQQSGFADLKYAVVSGKYSSGTSASSMELSFSGPRQGIAAWLASPTTLGGLDFVSPHAASAGAVVLKNPAQMFEDIKNMAEVVNPMASMGLTQMETEFNVNLKEDLLGKLGGQLAFAIEGGASPTPAWKTMVQVSDPDGLQKTFKHLLATVNEKATDGKGATLQQETEDGRTYYSVGFFTGSKHEEVDYTFADGYLIAASTTALLKEALEIHRSGTSLAKSTEFLKLLPPEHSGQASAVLFQNTALTMAAMAKQMPPELAQVLQFVTGQNQFSVMTVYGEENAIRATSNNQQMDMLVPLVVAAVAIPNLMRSRTAANESAAAATVRTLNTTQVMYETIYPNRGFASDIATLGPGSAGDCGKNGPTEQNACLLDAKLAKSGCASGTWCIKDGFQYSMVATCEKGLCQDYVVVATPTSSNTGGKSFCSTSDAVVRSKTGPPLTDPVNVAECQTWTPL